MQNTLSPIFYSSPLTFVSRKVDGEIQDESCAFLNARISYETDIVSVAAVNVYDRAGLTLFGRRVGSPDLRPNVYALIGKDKLVEYIRTPIRREIEFENQEWDTQRISNFGLLQTTRKTENFVN